MANGISMNPQSARHTDKQVLFSTKVIGIGLTICSVAYGIFHKCGLNADFANALNFNPAHCPGDPGYPKSGAHAEVGGPPMWCLAAVFGCAMLYGIVKMAQSPRTVAVPENKWIAMNEELEALRAERKNS